MKADLYKKWKDKYCKCDISHFKIIGNRIYHKGVWFNTFHFEEELKDFNNFTEQEKLNFLNGSWNFYMAIQD